jgi:hypothetical protein
MSVLTSPFMYWVGMETDPRTTPDALAEFNRFYSSIHVHEVVAAHPGFVSASRYELLDPDPRGGVHHGPRWLAVYEMADESSAIRYIKDSEKPWLHRRKYSPWPPARRRAKTVWRMIWRRLSVSGSSDQAAESIFMVGMNVPADAEADDLAAFNAFYSDTHVPEVMAHGGYARGSRWELYRPFAHPEPGCPRFCAIYEADATATNEREARRAAPATMTPGPPLWDKRDTLWRLRYGHVRPDA